jgi:cation/acetate symporter
MIGGLGGELLTALLTAGAFAAFLATSSGLTIAVAGVITQDVMSKRLEGVTAFRVSAVVAVVVPILLALVTRDVAVATVVGLAFAMAAATFCPLLVLGIWWRGLTDVGALAGLLVGGLSTGGAVLDNLLTHRTGGWFAVLVAQPAAWAVPLSFATMVVVSKLTRHRLPAHTARFMVRLHTPENVQLDRG